MALTYKSAGVNKHEGYNEVNLIKKFIKNTYTKGVLSDLGGFSGLFELGKEFILLPENLLQKKWQVLLKVLQKDVFNQEVL